MQKEVQAVKSFTWVVFTWVYIHIKSPYIFPIYIIIEASNTYCCFTGYFWGETETIRKGKRCQFTEGGNKNSTYKFCFIEPVTC